MKKVKLPTRVKNYLGDKKKYISNPTTEVYLGKSTITVLKKGTQSGNIKRFKKTGKTINFKGIK